MAGAPPANAEARREALAENFKALGRQTLELKALSPQDRRRLIAQMRKQVDVLRSAFLSETAILIEQAAIEMEYDLLAWAPAREPKP